MALLTDIPCTGPLFGRDVCETVGLSCGCALILDCVLKYYVTILLYITRFYCNHFMYHVAFEFLR